MAFRDASSHLPRAFPNVGVWCWVNSLLQGLASIANPLWWAILSLEPRSDDLLAALAAALLWINRSGRKADIPPRSLMSALTQGLVAECGLSPSAEQDVHEALLQVLEAVHAGLLRRQLVSARSAPFRAPWQPLGPPLLHVLGHSSWSSSTFARGAFLELWQGTLLERRVCVACGFEKQDDSPCRQAFRCLTLHLPSEERVGHAFADAAAIFRECFQGEAAETLEQVLCPRCSLLASSRRLRYLAARGCWLAWRACCALSTLAALPGPVPDPERLQHFLPLGSPLVELARETHLRTFSMREAPRVLALHLRRLTFGSMGASKSSARVHYPPTMLVRLDLTQCGARTTNDMQLLASRAYVLQAAVAHLGGAHGGHFLVHRRWPGRHSSSDEALQKVLDNYGVVAADAIYTAFLMLRPALQFGAWRCSGLADCYRWPWVRANDDAICRVAQVEALRFPGGYMLFYENA